MKKRDLGEIKNKSLVELERLVMEGTSDLQLSSLELALKKVKNVHLISQKKKDLAKIKTILEAKKLIAIGEGSDGTS